MRPYAGGMSRKPYPSDLSEEEWAFVAPYLTLMTEEAPQREHSLREVFNALRWLARAGAPWRMLPNDFPPWAAVYQQFRCWSDAGCFEALVSDMRPIIRAGKGRQEQPSAVVLDGPRCKALARAARVRATTATNAARARKCTWLWIRWAISSS